MYRKKYLFILFIFILLSVFITQPSNYVLDNLKVNQVSDKTIFSPRYIKYKDDILTQQLIDTAKNNVQKVYDSDKSIYENVAQDLDDFTSSMIDTNKYIRTQLNNNSSVPIDANSQITDPNSFINAQLLKVKNPFNFSLDELKLFYKLDDNTLKLLNDAYSNELKIAFDNPIDESNLDTVRQNFANRTNFYYLDKNVRTLLTSKLKDRIVVNLTFNQEETDKRIQDAISKVKPVFSEYQKGETIVRAGEIVTQSQIEVLTQLGLIKSNINYKNMVQVLPYNAFLLIILHFYIFKFHPQRFKKTIQYVFLLSSLVLGILMTNLIKDSSFYLIPILTILMLLVVFWGRQLTLVVTLILGMLINIGDYEYLILTVFSGILLSLFFKERGNRIDLIITGIYLGIGLSIISSVYSVVLEVSLQYDKIFYIISSSFISSLLAMGFIPLFEMMLGYVTSLKLHELHNPNHPLLKRLIREAPGTYHHSLMVGNLAETAAEEVGADSLLLRVGAFFHDVGKLRNPEFFIENSTPLKNPHENIEPLESAKIIKRHPIDSVEMCKKHNIPEPILNLIISHHGDSLVKYFYSKAKEQNSEINEDDFRYTTPTPKTKEEGILLLADTIEAYSRTIMNKPKDEFEQLIKSMVYSKINEGVLRNCELSLKDIDVIVYTFVNFLLSTNHERISYKN